MQWFSVWHVNCGLIIDVSLGLPESQLKMIASFSINVKIVKVSALSYV